MEEKWIDGTVEAMSEEELLEWSRETGELVGHRFFKTSGSSGAGKWIALSGEALEWSARAVNEALGIGSEDVLGLALPTIHVGGFGLVERGRISGARVVEFSGKWDAVRFASWCEDEGVSVSSLVPTQVNDLVREKCVSPKCLRVIVVGGGFFENELREGALALGWPVVPSYGMTETGSQVATGVGLPLLPGWEARVVDGCLALRGGGLLTGIVTSENGEISWHDPKEEGWFLTNDWAQLSEGGLRILGRADRRVKVLGELVDLDELEGFWRGKLGCEVALISSPHERNGSVLHLFLEGSEDGVAEVNQALPGPERVSSWHGVAGLPRSPLGKIDRSALSKFHENFICKGNVFEGI